MGSSNGIRAVLFDLDGTLRHNQPHSTHTFLDYAVELGMQDCPESRRAVLRWTHYYWAQSAELFEDRQVFEGLTDDFWAHYALRSLWEYGCPPEQAQALAPAVYRRMTEEYIAEDIVPEDVSPTLAWLKEAGLPLAVVSNRSQPYDELLEKLGLVDFFEFSVAAGEVNSWKPEAGIFRHALERLKVYPSQAVYVGDNYYADVIGARGAGLIPILFDPESIFSEADCLTIRRIDELREVIGNSVGEDR